MSRFGPTRAERDAQLASMPRDEKLHALVADLVDSSIMPLVRAVILRRSQQIIDFVREELDKQEPPK